MTVKLPLGNFMGITFFQRVRFFFGIGFWVFSFHQPSLRNSACAQRTWEMVPCTPETNLGLLIRKGISLDVPNAFFFFKKSFGVCLGWGWGGGASFDRAPHPSVCLLVE